jgi:REP element-mobilizing transposase RayT
LQNVSTKIWENRQANRRKIGEQPMTLFRNKYRVESARLKKWDYSSPGYYFVTICAYNRRCIFGEIIDGEMKMNANGKIVNDEWLQSFAIRRDFSRDEFIVMPNHFHAIVRILDSGNSNGHDAMGLQNKRDVTSNVSTMGKCTTMGKYGNGNTASSDSTRKFMSGISPKPDSLSVFVRCFKSAVTRQMRSADNKGEVWQPRFHDHIIRNDRELFTIRRYIKNNPVNWAKDRNVIESEGNNQGDEPWSDDLG